MEFIEQGTKNIICVQPLACLPNHVAGKGMFKPLKEKFPYANIIPIDYDPGLSSVNQLNRIKLLLSVAMKNLKEE
jgi:predicted nucleotide-binding protein (sugar kinase/HSP70/actin superfamily)